MKKIFYISLIALTTLVACNKKGTTPVVSQEADPMAWLYDESLPVPIMFNTGDLAETKAGGLIESAEFTAANFYYGITAVNTEGVANLFNDGYAIAKNTSNASLTSGNYMAQFVEGSGSGATAAYTPVTYYYPLQTTATSNYTFYGYRANETNEFDLTTVTVGTSGLGQIVSIGHQDILWGKAAATPFELDTRTYQGFNARYVRKAWEKVSNVAADFYSTYAPKMNFLHVTSAFQFMVKTDQDRPLPATPNTQKFIDADIYVKSIEISGVHTQANFKVVSSDGLNGNTLVVGNVLAPYGTTGTIPVDPETVVIPDYTKTFAAVTLYYQTDPSLGPAVINQTPSSWPVPRNTALYMMANPTDNNKVTLITTTVTDYAITNYSNTEPEDYTGYFYASNPEAEGANPKTIAISKEWSAYPVHAGNVTRADKYFPEYNSGTGKPYGNPLLVLPSAVEGLGEGDVYATATIVFNFPGQPNDEESVTMNLTVPTDGFEPGKKYVFTILVHSPEEIEVVTSLAEWTSGASEVLEIE